MNLSSIDEKEMDLYQRCMTCRHNLAGLFLCLKVDCPNYKKYCCMECFVDDSIHDHKPKKTQLVIDEWIRDFREKWQTLRTNVEKLVKATKPKFASHE